MATINVGRDFSPDPAGRYRSDGESSGEAFREDILKPTLEMLREGETLKVVIDDGVEDYGSSFLVEGFAGLVKHGYFDATNLLARIEIVYTDSDFEFYKNKIIGYIKGAKFNSEATEIWKARATQLEDAIAAEREACAKVADECWVFGMSSAYIADAIRARGGKT